MTIDHSTEDLVFLNLSSNTDPVYLKDEVQLPNYIRTKIPEQFTKEELKQLNGKLYYVIIKLNDEGKIIEAETLNQKSKKGATVFDEKLSKLFLNAPRCLVVQPTEHMINSFTIPIKF
ncbi:MAG TPA: hypothetical protein PLL00_06275 [Bacteroidia bacterium]|nr:hypothetical protein [Bacteroidia bacterium]